MTTKVKLKTPVVTGNEAAALGAKLAKPAVVSVYPITPQTQVCEKLAKYIATGELKAEIVEAEGEHSVMSILHGAALAGARTFTATSAVGLFFMFEPYIRTSTLRLPIVMAIANRELNGPNGVASGQSDTFVVREAGWIQLYVEDCQEILDTIIMAYKIAENESVRLPVNVCYDGYYLSHLYEPVMVPDQALVDRFLPPYRPALILDPDHPLTIDGWTPGELLPSYRDSHMKAMEEAKEVINSVDREYGEVFGRSYGGLFEKYRVDDADLILITVGSCTGTARVVVDEFRDQLGVNIGLVKLRSVRPFPRKELCRLLDGRAVVGVMDRQVSFGWNSGSICWELKSALYEAQKRPAVIGFMGGMAGADISPEVIREAINLIIAKSQGKVVAEATWLGPQPLE